MTLMDNLTFVWSNFKGEKCTRKVWNCKNFTQNFEMQLQPSFSATLFTIIWKDMTDLWKDLKTDKFLFDMELFQFSKVGKKKKTMTVSKK